MTHVLTPLPFKNTGNIYNGTIWNTRIVNETEKKENMFGFDFVRWLNKQPGSRGSCGQFSPGFSFLWESQTAQPEVFEAPDCAGPQAKSIIHPWPCTRSTARLLNLCWRTEKTLHPHLITMLWCFCHFHQKCLLDQHQSLFLWAVLFGSIHV